MRRVIVHGKQATIQSDGLALCKSSSWYAINDDGFVQILTKCPLWSQDLLEQNVIGISATTSMMTQLRNAAAALGRELDVKYRVSTIEAARSLVKAGLGVMIQPESMLPVEDLNKVTLVALDEPWALRRLCIGTRRGDSLTAATRAFVARFTD